MYSFSSFMLFLSLLFSFFLYLFLFFIYFFSQVQDMYRDCGNIWYRYENRLVGKLLVFDTSKRLKSIHTGKQIKQMIYLSLFIFLIIISLINVFQTAYLNKTPQVIPLHFCFDKERVIIACTSKALPIFPPFISTAVCAIYITS